MCLTLCQLNPVHASSSYFLKFNFNISPHLSEGLPSDLFPSGLPTKILYKPLHPAIRSTCLAHLILNFITQIIFGEQYRSLIPSLCIFLHSIVISSLLGPNILLSTLFSNIVGLFTSLNAKDQFSHPYKTTGNVRVMYILINAIFFSVSLCVEQIMCNNSKLSIRTFRYYKMSYCTSTNYL